MVLYALCWTYLTGASRAGTPDENGGYVVAAPPGLGGDSGLAADRDVCEGWVPLLLYDWGVSTGLE